MTTIPNNSTIETVWHKLAHPRDYISGVIQRMFNCVKLHGNAEVRIGVTGKGEKPCYRILYRQNGREEIFGSWWDNHDVLAVGDVKNSNWSTASMTFDEVSALAKQFKPNTK